MRPMISCPSKRKRNVKDIRSPALCKLVLAFPSDMCASKVHKDALAGSGESCEAFWCAASNQKSLDLGWDKVGAGGSKNHCALFCLSKASLIPIIINHHPDCKNAANISCIL